MISMSCFVRECVCVYVCVYVCMHEGRYTFKSHLVCFHVLAIVNSAVMNTRIHVSFGIMAFSGYIPRSQVAGSYGSFIPYFLRNPHTVLHGECMNLYSHQWRVPFSPHLLQDLLFIDFFDDAILTGVRHTSFTFDLHLYKKQIASRKLLYNMGSSASRGRIVGSGGRLKREGNFILQLFSEHSNTIWLSH